MTNTENIRQIALESLIEILEKKQYANLIENQVLTKYAYLEKRDRAFYTRLVEGTLERLVTLDYYINAVSRVPVKKQKPLIRTLLRMSVYQILYMDSVPDSAAINEAVKLAKKRGFASLSGFVNGVLRNLSRQRDQIAPPKDLATVYSYPQWMVSYFMEQYPAEKVEEILHHLNLPQDLIVRVNLQMNTVEQLQKELKTCGITAVPVPETSCGLALSQIDRLTDLDAFVQGKFYVQDASSMMVAEHAGIREGDYVIDVCAAPGGKSTHAAQILNGTGCVDSRDLTEYKVSLIEENINRLRLSNMTAKVWDATVLDESVVNRADVVICDAPCSGLGVMGKKKDIRYRVTREDITELSHLQMKILENAKCYVKNGGTLLYSTCTITREENEQVVEQFLKNNPDFTLEMQRQILPHEIGNDGFFFAKMKKNQG